MRIGTSWRRSAVLLVSGAMVLAACGGDGEGDTAGDAASDSAAPTDGATATAGEVGGGDMSPEDVTFDVGVTAEPCPEGVNEDNGCIYLGTLSDLTEGPFAGLGPQITEAQAAFWNRVNEGGGIGGAFDVDASEYVRDNKYNPEVTAQLYQEIEPEVLALAQSLGSPPTAAITSDLIEDNVMAAPATWASSHEFNDVLVESGNNYCVEAANGLDWWAQDNEVGSVIAIHYPGDYGEDGAAGAMKWAEANGAEFRSVEQTPLSLGGTTDGTISQIVSQNPSVVYLTVAPSETAEIVGGAVAQGYEGIFIGSSPTWNVALLQTPAADALTQSYYQAAPWAPWDADTPAHAAMREALADMQPNGGAISGWAWSYPLLAVLNQGVTDGDLTREGLLNALTNLETVDYEGMLPEAAGDFSGTPKEQSFDQTIIAQPDPEAADGTTLVEDFYQGETVDSFAFENPCFEELS